MRNSATMILKYGIIPVLIITTTSLSALDEFFEIKYLEPKPVVIPNLDPANVRFPLDYVISFTLQHQWDIYLSYETVEVQEGNYEITHAPFDLRIDADYTATRKFDLLQGNETTDKNGDEEVLNVGLSKLFRLGTQANFGATVDRLKTFPEDSRNTFHAFFTLDQPLLRRYMWSLETATEIASYIELKAVKWEMVQSIADQISTVVHAYWDLLRTKQLLQVNIESEKRLMALADYVNRLIENNQLARSERNQALADLYAARNQRIASEQNLYSAYNNLLFEMGEEPCQRLLDAPHLILNDYPEVPENLDITLEHLICLSENHRGDLLAAEWRVSEQTVFLRYANNALLPELDLQLGVTLDKVRRGEDKINPFFVSTTKKPERDLSAGVSFSYPLCNDFARGTYRRTYAEVIEAQLEEDKLRESIRTAVSSTWRNHTNLVEQIKITKETVYWYEQALVDEVKRFHEGVSTLFFVIQFEDKLSTAQSNLVQLYHDYANNLVDLLFLTGLLAVPDSELSTVYIADVTSAHDLLGRSIDCDICKERR